MTNKLKQYSDERSRLAFEKETLSAENKQITNRLEMEKVILIFKSILIITFSQE